jgi:effector-binding domain-containing protein
MAATIETREITPRPYVGIRRTVKHDGLGSACAEILPRVAAWLAGKGLAPAGPPICVYHSVNQATDDFDAQPGFFVSAAVPGEGEITAGETAGGEALYALHVGPYEKLGETWAAVFARAEASGRPVTKSSWEAYLNTPGEVSPSEIRTEIFVPIDAPRASPATNT